ncbi:hypothetical protein CDV55_105450 [Aspergillus turcosus]|nr:hypothetical protein CDV55_105450 [Aspergillus turcosus]
MSRLRTRRLCSGQRKTDTKELQKRQGNEDIVDLLLEQPRIQPDLPDMAYALSQSENHYGRTPLAHAVINGHGKIVERLIGLGVDLNSRDLLGKTPLYHAVEAGNIHLVSLLLATSGINPNARNYKRAMAPLHYAAWKGNVAIVGLLLSVEDIDVNVKNQAQRLPVHGRPVEVQSYLQEKARLGELEYTIIAVGLFLDYVVSSPIVVDLVNRTAVLYNGGEHPFSTTSAASIGKAIVGALKNPDATRNRVLHVHDMVLMQSRVLALAKKYTPPAEA